MKEIHLAGTREELGRAYGEMIADQELNTWWQTPSPAKVEFVKACEDAVATHAPGYLDELRALAAATDTDYYTVLANMIVADWLEFPACNCVAVSGKQTVTGQPIFIRNHDWADEDIEYVTCFRTVLTGGLRHIAFGFADPGRYDGINEAGLAVGGSSIPFYKGKLKPGLRGHVVTRWILDTCSNVMEAVEFMKRVPHMEADSKLLADKSGLVARVEVTPEGDVDVTITEDGMLSTVNMFQSESLAPLDRITEKEAWVPEFKRRIEAWYETNQGAISLEEAIRFASDHDAGICNHGEEGVRYGTIYSWVGELGLDELHLSLGRPCRNDYRLLQLQVP